MDNELKLGQRDRLNTWEYRSGKLSTYLADVLFRVRLLRHPDTSELVKRTLYSRQGRYKYSQGLPVSHFLG